ncbi:TPA: hypothetical protein ACSQK5_006542, partial [Pseudomonas aeruginosa]
DQGSASPSSFTTLISGFLIEPPLNVKAVIIARVKALWVGNPSLCLQPDVAGETAVYRVSTFE